MKRIFAFRRRQRAKWFVRKLISVFGEYDALTEVRNRKQAKLLLRHLTRT